MASGPVADKIRKHATEIEVRHTAHTHSVLRSHLLRIHTSLFSVVIAFDNAHIWERSRFSSFLQRRTTISLFFLYPLTLQKSNSMPR
jgi:hypothetical protein